MAKTHTTLDIANRDGPLLNFCRLAHLGTLVLPFKGSGLKDTDFEKLLDLMQKMTEDKRLPLMHASTPVWEELRQLRDEVADISKRISSEDAVVDMFERSCNKDEINTKALLVKIERVYRHRPSSTHEHHRSDHIQDQASGISTDLQPNPPTGGLLLGHEKSSYASSPTAVSEDRRNISPAQEVNFDGIALSPSNNSSGTGAFANLYRTPYPHLPSQIGPSGAITHPFSASILPNLFPHLGSSEITPPGISPAHPPLPHMLQLTDQPRCYRCGHPQ
ncbi:hypothetical protein EI94DRAFT_468179 [Lactarius quietus]|nr:hypothetical protein EI94DRAFT_468179 [Lactarius quietus]